MFEEQTLNRRAQSRNFGQTLFSQHFLDVENAGLHLIIAYVAEQHDLRMLRFMGKSARDLHRFNDRSICSQSNLQDVLPRRRLQVDARTPGVHGHLGIVKISAVCLPDGYLKFVKR